MSAQTFMETSKFLSESKIGNLGYARANAGPYETTYYSSYQGGSVGRPYTTGNLHASRPMTMSMSRSYEMPGSVLKGSSSGQELFPYTASYQKMVSKYNPSQWHASNRLNVSSGEKERATAERLRDECSRLRTETSLLTHRAQMDVNKKLDYRLHDINYWKSELEKQHNETVAEIKALQAFIGRLEKALAATEKPMNVSGQCLSFRERRQKIDLVHDNVESHLNKEVDMIHACRALLEKTIQQAHDQLWQLRNAKHQLEKDLGDKYGALNIDGKCATLNNFSKEIHYAAGSVNIPVGSFTPDEWEAYSSQNIAKAERERKASVALRGEINSILMQSYVDLRTIYEKVNEEYCKRIDETIGAKKNLEKELARVCDELASMENNIRQLRQAIADKEHPLMLAHTRLDKRGSRPNVELCRDPVQYRLVQEVGQINTSVDYLRMRLAEAEASMQALLRNKANLEDDIEVKTNSLFIDRDNCMTVRQQCRHISH